MSDPFAEMVDEVFAEPGFAKPALYRAAGTGDPVPVSVVVSSPDRLNTIVGLAVVQASLQAEVRLSEVPAFAQTDTLEIGGTVYKPSGKPMKDEGGRLWRIGMVPA